MNGKGSLFPWGCARRLLGWLLTGEEGRQWLDRTGRNSNEKGKGGVFMKTVAIWSLRVTSTCYCFE